MIASLSKPPKPPKHVETSARWEARIYSSKVEGTDVHTDHALYRLVLYMLKLQYAAHVKMTACSR